MIVSDLFSKNCYLICLSSIGVGAAKLQQNVSPVVKNLSSTHLLLYMKIPFPDPIHVNSWENLDLSIVTPEIANWLDQPIVA